MSLQTALQFIRRIREDSALAERIRSLGRAPDLEDIVRIASEAGFELTVEELRAAHRQDATLRWVGYRSDSPA